MATTNLNIRADKEVKEKADRLFNELGLTMTAAINLFLRASIREQGIPFALTLDKPNRTTMDAIEEGRRIATNPTVEGYHTMDALRSALDI